MTGGRVIAFPAQRTSEPWVDIRTLAAALCMSESFIEKAVRKEGLPSEKFGRSRRYRVGEVERWLVERSRRI